MKRNISWKRMLASALVVGTIATSLFPGTAYAAEVGAQVGESTDAIEEAITENLDSLASDNVQDNEETVNDAVSDEETVMDQSSDNSDTHLTEGSETDVTKQKSETEETSVSEHGSADEVLSDGNCANEKALTRLIVTSEAPLTDYYDAVAIDHYDNLYILTYETPEALNYAYELFVSAGVLVEKDYAIDAINETEIPEEKIKDEVTDTQVTDTLEDTSESAIFLEETVEDHQTIIAVIDTGISDIDKDDVFKGRIVEGTSTISDSYVDDNGHGTAMAKIIAEDTEDENIAILPIKALDENGKGTVLSVALAIKYAKEHGADVISLSLSGIGQSNVLTNAINDCYNNGITVVTAAGNDNADSMNYMPGNVDAAINIAAAEYDANGKIVAAGYTNHGDNVDFAALGTYQLSVTKNNTTIDTQLVGTSVAAAHVSAYVALIKQINSTVDGIVTEISENDVLESLKASAQNVEGVSRTYFGNGFLDKDKLMFKSSENTDSDKETDLPEAKDDGEQEILKNGYFIDSYGRYWCDSEASLRELLQSNANNTIVLTNHISITSPIFVEGTKNLSGYVGNGNSAQISNCIGADDPSNFMSWLSYHSESSIIVSPNAKLTVSNCNFNGNSHYIYKSAYHPDFNCKDTANIHNLGTLIATNCIFQNSKGDDGTAALYLNENSSATLKKCIVTGSKEGIIAGGKKQEFTECQIFSNERIGVLNMNGTSAINDCNIQMNKEDGIYVDKGSSITTQNTKIFSNKRGITCVGSATIKDTNIYSNEISGINSSGKVSFNGGDIYSNTYGIDNRGTLNFKSGNVYNNNSTYPTNTQWAQGCGIINNGGTCNISGGTIRDNGWGNVWNNKGTLNISGGTISQTNGQDQNTSFGIWNNDNCIITGGDIYGYTTWNNGYEASAIRNCNTLTVRGNNTSIHHSSIGIDTAEYSKTECADCKVYSNKYGISNYGNLSLTGGYVYNNSDTGVMCMGGTNTLNSTIENNQITGVYVAPNQTATNYGTIRSNDYYGVFVSEGATYNHEAGSIHNNNQKRSWYEGGAGIRNLGTTNLKGGYIDSNYWANVWNQGTLSVTGTHLLNCQGGTGGTPGNPDYYYNSFQPAYGIVNDNYGTTTINGDIGISGNSTTGVWANSGTVNFHKGTVSDNTGKGFEVLNAGNNIYATLNMYGGTVRNNAINLYNTGTSNISGGEITKSTQMNVDIYNGTVNFKGGSIIGSGRGYYGVHIENNGGATFNQFANIGINYDGGIRNKAIGLNRYNVYNGATSAVGSDGKNTGVYLEAGASMSIHQPLTADIKVASYDRYTGKVIANCDNEAIAQSAQQHLKLTSNASFQKTTLNTRKYADTYSDVLNAYGYNYEALWNHYNTYGRNEGRVADDCGKAVVYRQGNGATGAKTQIIVSQTEKTLFNENLAANGLTSDRISAKIRTSDTFSGHKNSRYQNYVTTYWGEANAPRAESLIYIDGVDVSRSIYNTGWAHTSNGALAYGRILNAYVSWYPTTLYAKYDTGCDPNANHNPIDNPEKDDGTEDIVNPAPINPSDPEDTNHPQGNGYTLYFDGNGNTNDADNFVVHGVKNGYRLPYNDRFIKVYENVTRYDARNKADITYDDQYSAQGWSVNHKATYLDKTGYGRCMLPEEPLDTLGLVSYCLDAFPQNVIISENSVILTEYVVWDRAPLIDAADKYWYYSEITEKTDEEIIASILSTVRVSDDEDTAGEFKKVNDCSLDVKIIDFNRTAYDNLGEFGVVTVTCEAIDGAGNISHRLIEINVTNANSKNESLDKSSGPLECSYRTYIRFIDLENYNKTKTVDGQTIPDTYNGGLEPDSVWYYEDTYRQTITNALQNIEGESSEVSYEFDVYDIAASKYYCKVHGVGDYKERNNNRNWYQKFIVEDGAKVSGTLPVPIEKEEPAVASENDLL